MSGGGGASQLYIFSSLLHQLNISRHTVYRPTPSHPHKMVQELKSVVQTLDVKHTHAESELGCHELHVNQPPSHCSDQRCTAIFLGVSFSGLPWRQQNSSVGDLRSVGLGTNCLIDRHGNSTIVQHQLIRNSQLIMLVVRPGEGGVKGQIYGRTVTKASAVCTADHFVFICSANK